jgi:signal peptidase I
MDEARPVRKRRRRRVLLLLLPIAAGMLWYGSRAVGYVANHRAFQIPSASMAPAIVPGDRIVVDTRGDKPKRGEIWAFAGPNSTMIKRVIGLPGETIEIVGGQVLIDGRPLPEPYLTAPTATPMAPIRLGPEHYFMMGDSRKTSLDSRAWGPLHEKRFIGRAEQRYWPPDRVGPVR